MGKLSLEKRWWQITSVFLGYFVFHRFNKHSRKSFGRRLRYACEELGTTFIKMGQILSTRYDVLPEKHCKELRKLLDEVKPIPFEKVREIIKHDLGKYPEEIFKEFDPQPIASASVSQVYKAIAHDGTKVAVKVRRPYLGRKIELDMRILRRLMSIAQLFSSTLRYIRVTKLIDELEVWLLQEIDFRKEAKNQVNLRKFLESHEKGMSTPSGNIVLPFLFPKLCSDNIITMNFIEGVPLNKHKEIEHDSRYDARASAKTYVIASLRGLFDNKPFMFQADPHPANLIILENGDVATVDFGLVGSLDAKQTKSDHELFLAIYAQNVDETVKALLALCRADHDKYASRIRKDVALYLPKTASEGAGYWFTKLFGILYKHNVPFPMDLTLFGRANVVFDGLLHMVDPQLTTMDLFGEELKRALARKIVSDLKNIDYTPVLYNLINKIKKNPQLLNKLIDKYYENPLKVIKDVRKIINT